MKRNKSGVKGQALVLVTLGLISMCGLMGLAVDLGWSYFVEKQAQTAADTAALAAAQEANIRIGSTAFGFVCPVAAASNMEVFCQQTVESCTVIQANTDSNLHNGCLYAAQNGFTQGGMGGRQTVTVQAYDSTIMPADVSGIAASNVAYWVTVRTTQTVPQLFSAVLGNAEGTVTAKATAALISSVYPGSFIALNREGDCISDRNKGFTEFCGVDVDITGSQLNNKPCQNSGGFSASLCAANGIILSSTCNGTSNPAGCQDGGNGNQGFNFAGQTQGGANVWARMAQVRSGGAVDDPSKWTPVPVSTTGGMFDDPYVGKEQPPLQVPSSGGALQGCAIEGGVIQGTSGNNAPLQLGPYQYYATSGGTATGGRIEVDGNVTFSAGGACPVTPTGPAVGQPAFPSYLFYGGMEVAGDINFGPGQYVMVGTNTDGAASLLLSGGNQTVTGDTGAGTQFITTDLGYPDLSSQFANVPTALTDGTIPLYQGHIELKAGNSTNLQLQGIDRASAPTELGAYNGSLFWQDRRNSTLRLDDEGVLIDRPCENGCSSIPGTLTSRGVTSKSPGFIYDAAVQLDLEGTLYQPRGAWFSFQGNADISSGLQIITGMVHMTGGGQVSLLPSPVPIIDYVVALIY